MGFLGSRPWVSSPVLAMVGTRLRLSHSQRSPLYLILACCLRMCCRVTLGTMRIPRLGRAHSAWFHGLRNVKQTPKFSWQWFSVLLYDGGALSRALESYNSKCCAVALKMGLQDASSRPHSDRTRKQRQWQRLQPFRSTDNSGRSARIPKYATKRLIQFTKLSPFLATLKTALFLGILLP